MSEERAKQKQLRYLRSSLKMNTNCHRSDFSRAMGDPGTTDPAFANMILDNYLLSESQAVAVAALPPALSGATGEGGAAPAPMPDIRLGGRRAAGAEGATSASVLAGIGGAAAVAEPRPLSQDIPLREWLAVSVASSEGITAAAAFAPTGEDYASMLARAEHELIGLSDERARLAGYLLSARERYKEVENLRRTLLLLIAQRNGNVEPGQAAPPPDAAEEGQIPGAAAAETASDSSDDDCKPQYGLTSETKKQRTLPEEDTNHLPN